MTQKDGAADTAAPEPTVDRGEHGEGVLGRWEPFTDAEQMILRECVREFVDRVLHQAGQDLIDPEYRDDAALTMLGAANMMCELDEARGDVTPNYEVFAMSAQLISNGRYAETLKEMSDTSAEDEDDASK